MFAFLSTPSARRATEEVPGPLSDEEISIHALREEGDPFLTSRYDPVTGISIHALREEGDVPSVTVTKCYLIFLSTPSARRATAKTEKNISAFVSL